VAHTDSGLFSIYAGTGADDASEALALIGRAVQRMAEPVDEPELARARSQLKAGLLMALESPFAQSEQLGRNLLIYDRVIAPAELVERIDAVDAAAVERVAQRLLSAKPSLAVLGPPGAVDDGLAAALGL
ncbi:MAG: insulinase family protein, partial [Alphaproteobacteria bacterium]